jgi:hypothetical protein
MKTEFIPPSPQNSYLKSGVHAPTASLIIEKGQFSWPTAEETRHTVNCGRI